MAEVDDSRGFGSNSLGIEGVESVEKKKENPGFLKSLANVFDSVSNGVMLGGGYIVYKLLEYLKIDFLNYDSSDSYTGFRKTIFPSNESSTTFLDLSIESPNKALDNSFKTIFCMTLLMGLAPKKGSKLSFKSVSKASSVTTKSIPLSSRFSLNLFKFICSYSALFKANAIFYKNKWIYKQD